MKENSTYHSFSLSQFFGLALIMLLTFHFSAGDLFLENSVSIEITDDSSENETDRKDIEEKDFVLNNGLVFPNIKDADHLHSTLIQSWASTPFKEIHSPPPEHCI